MSSINDSSVSGYSYVKKHREKLKAEGKKTIQITLSPEVYSQLNTLKATNGGTYSTVVSESIMSVKDNLKLKTEENEDSIDIYALIASLPDDQRNRFNEDYNTDEQIKELLVSALKKEVKRLGSEDLAKEGDF